VVDAAGIGGREKLLPGEISRCRVHWERSADAIVVGGNEPRIDTVEDSQASEGRTLRCSKCSRDPPTGGSLAISGTG